MTCVYGDHMANRHPPAAPIPDCQDYARFDMLDRAEYLMGCMVGEFGGTWRVMKHGQHFHITEVPTVPASPPTSGEGK